MSEPEAAFLKLRIGRATLDRWLDAPPVPASKWDDWRAIGGQWYLSGDPVALADATDAELRNLIDGADAAIARYPDNRTMLKKLLGDYAEAPELRLTAFDATGTAFVAGTLTWSESIDDFILFLALARSAASHLGPGESGIAIIHNYLFGGPDEQVTTAALRLGPGDESILLPRHEWSEVEAQFEPIAEALVEGELPTGFDVRDEIGLAA